MESGNHPKIAPAPVLTGPPSWRSQLYPPRAKAIVVQQLACRDLSVLRALGHRDVPALLSGSQTLERRTSWGCLWLVCYLQGHSLAWQPVYTASWFPVLKVPRWGCRGSGSVGAVLCIVWRPAVNTYTEILSAERSQLPGQGGAYLLLPICLSWGQPRLFGGFCGPDVCYRVLDFWTPSSEYLIPGRGRQ